MQPITGSCDFLDKALITGSCGFLGKALTQSFTREGKRTSGIDYQGGVERLRDLSVHFFDLSPWLSVASCVYHLAGTAAPAAHEGEDGRAVRARDFQATRRVLEGCQRSKIPVLVMSSSWVYGANIPKRTLAKECHPDALDPTTSYGLTKKAIEQLCLEMAGEGLTVGVARLFNVYGPGQEKAVTYHSTFILDTIKHMVAHPFDDRIVKNPKVSRDFIYIDDAIAGLRSIGEHLCKQKSGFYCYNVGTGVAFNLLDATLSIATAADYTGRIIPESHSDRGNLCASTAKLESLGWKWRVPFQEGIARTVKHMRTLHMAEGE